jgi:hypothetical protein
MGTFHDDKGELHGITVVVDTHGPTVYIGRCDVLTEKQIVLNDVDQHEDGNDGKSKEDYLKFAAKFGTWKKHDRLIVPRDEISLIKPLGEYA